MGDNPFETTDRWEVSTDTMLPVGNFVVTIIDVEGATSRADNPQIIVKLENSQGTIRDWITYHDTLLGKVAKLFDSAGIPVPQEGEFDPTNKCRLSDGCLRRLLDKKVGIVIREEDDDRDPMNPKKRRRVQGYVAPSQISSDIPANTAGLSAVGAAATAADDDIPFAWEGPIFEFDLFHGHENR